MGALSPAGMRGLVGTFTGLSAISVSLRFYTRTRQQFSSLGLDDWSALFGTVTFIAAGALTLELVRLSPIFEPQLTPAQGAANAKTVALESQAYVWLINNTLACAKLSALFLYRRLFFVYRAVNWLVIVSAVVIVAWCFTFDALSLAECRSHFSALWSPDFLQYCGQLNQVWAKGLAISDFILDIYVLVFPLPMIWRLQMTWTRRLMIAGLFLLAYIGLGASVARIVIFWEAKGQNRADLYIGILEAGISITVVNLPIWYMFALSLPRRLSQQIQSLHRLMSKNDRSTDPATKDDLSARPTTHDDRSTRPTTEDNKSSDSYEMVSRETV